MAPRKPTRIAFAKRMYEDALTRAKSCQTSLESAFELGQAWSWAEILCNIDEDTVEYQLRLRGIERLMRKLVL